ncbi:GntR family transcriptional regulator [Azohydromonas caseinilytica]|uniref:GntR family transcriptional regulator n=1 Tax=Azohydromonas caseinilytica TaxID=2728836 RepID=A0A848FGE2_9BURK|nr:GntR family transcriptional regulator [Azohydromonas caseinilytica]NML17323.1 GntR family transcriptional regulator [Azohydromonas caseinilytica]
MPSKATARADAAAAREHTLDEIVDKISAAILEHRLLPGTKLGEDRLATIFGTSRARIREVLARLAHDQVVELVPQRGAFVAKPTREQAQDVFEARRLIEPGVLRRLVATIDDVKQQRLRRHLDLEADARRREDKRAIVRLSGEFHVLLAELAGNSALLRSMRELSTLTCLIISLYDAPTATSCRADEHEEIVAAIKRGDVEAAQSLMLHHLDHIESSLDLEGGNSEADLESIFA